MTSVKPLGALLDDTSGLQRCVVVVDTDVGAVDIDWGEPLLNLSPESGRDMASESEEALGTEVPKFWREGWVLNAAGASAKVPC